MKKRRLKKWVKKTLILIVIISAIIINFKIYNDDVNKCVKNGYDRQTCRIELSEEVL